MTITTPTVADPLQHDAIAALYALDTLVRWDPDFNFTVIDFDLIQQRSRYRRRFASLDEACKGFADLEQRIGPSTHPHVSNKITSTAAVLRQLLDPNHYGLDEFLQQTIGTTPRDVPDDVLKRSAQRLVKAFEVWSGMDATSENMERHLDETSIPVERVERQFRDAERVLVPKFAEILGQPELEDYSISFVEEKDKYWTCWSTTDDDGRFLLKINKTPRRPWRAGAPEFFVTHEIAGHFMQAAALKRRIETGKAEPITGLTLLWGQEQVGLEGFANALPLFVDDVSFSPGAMFMWRGMEFRYLVGNVAWRKVIETGSPDEGVDLVLSLMPAYKYQSDWLRADMRDIIGAPDTCAYRFAYAVGFSLLREMSMSDPGRRLDVAKRMYRSLPTTSELVGAAEIEYTRGTSR